MEPNKTMCAGMEAKLAELLLDPATASATVKEHVNGCAGCGKELAELRSTMALMDAWEAPEPNPYFMTRFQARLNEEKQGAPAGFWAALRAQMSLGAQMRTRPVAATILTVLLLIGGGAYLNEFWQEPPAVPAQTAVVHDLQLLDNNAQLLDQMESISGDQN
jgi:hypothetical protein